MESLEQAVKITNQFAPHYLILTLAKPWDISKRKIRNRR
ncbi:Histidinol dehydrogenase [Crocosphaera watsonii WH 0402]|uniref:Histidinol dehydrogenase n=1 Tax=Crocosphaera watsonii WH 0402 TaxID=1284629 RepID=T2JKN0_CROWT|nr:Histidinol dehydrogenase [Crocosphaera watsonii WH 0402]